MCDADDKKSEGKSTFGGFLVRTLRLSELPQEKESSRKADTPDGSVTVTPNDAKNDDKGTQEIIEASTRSVMEHLKNVKQLLEGNHSARGSVVLALNELNDLREQFHLKRLFKPIIRSR